MRPNSSGGYGRRQSSDYFLLTNGRSWGLGLISLASCQGRAQGFLESLVQLDQGVELSLRGQRVENPGEPSFAGEIVIWKRQIFQVG